MDNSSSIGGPRSKPSRSSSLVAELVASALLLLEALGSIAIGLGLFSYLWHHALVLLYLIFYAAFDLADRAVRPAFDPIADRDRTPACRLNSLLMLGLFAAAPFERHVIHGGEPPAFLSVIALLVQLAGLSIALGARIQLGRFGTPHLGTVVGQSVIRSGLYRRIRHPIYTGGIISRQAWAILWGAPMVFLLGAIADVLLMSWRIRIEEAMMVENLGDQYRSYMSETKRLIPGIW